MKLGSTIKLNRMIIEEAAPDPNRMAAAIHLQLPLLEGPIPIRKIAFALDIAQIREAPTKSMEAALVTTAERDEGAILVNDRSSEQRRRFSIGHELLHFLNPAHQPIRPGLAFACTAQ